AFLEAYNNWSSDATVKMIGQPESKAESEAERKLQLLMQSPEYEKARLAVLAFVRRRVLRDTYHMKPGWMLELVDKYGPLDWRLATPHALYWSTYGSNHCLGIDLKAINSLNTDRNILNSLKDLTAYGRIALTYNAFDPSCPSIQILPDWRFVEACHTEHVAMNEFITGRTDGKTYELFVDGHLNYLSEAIQGLYFAGQTDRAEQLMRYVWDVYKPKDRKWRLDVEQFVVFNVNQEGVPRRQTIQMFIPGLLQQAYVAAVMGYQEESEIMLARAGRFWQRYRQTNTVERNTLPPFSTLQAYIAAELLQRLPTTSAAVLWDDLPVNVQLICYDIVVPGLRKRCEIDKVDFDKSFPAPPGLEEFRVKQAEMMKQAKAGQEVAEPAE
ncbi:MAG: hypothetical protein HQ546_02205, partial [Planctomycetes bacterium]|nr:hypothetical protein [Planctomycetota bacterium]